MKNGNPSERSNHPAPQPAGFIETLRRFGSYLLKPDPNAFEDIAQPLQTFGYLLLLMFLLAVPGFFLTTFARDYIEGEQRQIVETGTENEIIRSILLVMVVAPLIEEVSYRLFVTRFRLRYVAISAIAIIWFNLGGVLPTSGPLILTIMLFATWLFFYVNKSSRAIIGNWWNTHFGWVYYASLITFTLVHIPNIDYQNYGADELLLSPFVFAPQLFVGAVLGYARARYGLLMAIFLHGAYNGLLVIPSVI